MDNTSVEKGQISHISTNLGGEIIHGFFLVHS